MLSSAPLRASNILIIIYDILSLRQLGLKHLWHEVSVALLNSSWFFQRWSVKLGVPTSMSTTSRSLINLHVVNSYCIWIK